MRSDNLPLYPYFRIYGKNGDNWERIAQTWSQDGYQICEKVQNPARFLFYIDKTYQEFYIDVHSKWHYGDQLVAKGISVNAANLLKWADDSQNKDKTYKLEISKGNTIELKFDYVKKDRYYYFEIVSYKITNLDNEYKKYLYEAYQTWLLTKQNGVEDKCLYYKKGDKVFSPATANAPDYADIAQNRYNKEQRELLFSCTEGNNVKFMFSFDSKKYSLDTVELTTEEVVKQLNDCMKKYPKDHTKWIVKSVSKKNSEIILSFAGIPRKYILDAIVIPPGNPIQADPVYGNGYAPKYYIEITKKGDMKSKSYKDNSQGWIVKLNIPEPVIVREGMGEEYSIKIENWFTPPYSPLKGNKPIYTFRSIKDTDLKKRTLVQELPLATLPSTAIKVQVHDIENQINNLDSLKLYLDIQQ